MMYSLGADIGGSHISVGLFEHSNKSLLPETLIQKKVNRQASREEILSAWTDAILSSTRRVNHKIEGLGLAMPGPFDYYNGICLIAGVDKFESLYKVNVRDELARRLHFKPSNIRFINDASAFTIGESLAGQAAGHRRCVGITLGTGFGSSFTDRGRPVIRGEDVPAGGFLYDKMYCGRVADEVFSTRGVIQSFYDRTGMSCKSVLEISSRATSDRHATETFLHFGHELGRFLSPYLKKFNAEALVLGGNISRSFHLFQQSLQQELPGFHISVSEDGERSAMIGAARLLDDTYYFQIEETLKDM